MEAATATKNPKLAWVREATGRYRADVDSNDDPFDLSRFIAFRGYGGRWMLTYPGETQPDTSCDTLRECKQFAEGYMVAVRAGVA